MKPLIMVGILLIAALLLVGCPDTVVRDKVTFGVEVDYAEKVAVDLSTSLKEFVKTSCACVDGKFTTPLCKTSAEQALVASTRAGWHKAMSLYNGGITKDRPAKSPPEVPAPETLCP